MSANVSTKGFTLIEILVVLAIIAVLLTLVTPQYFNSIDRSKETVLRHDLLVMREAIDQFYGDRNVYPETLQELVDGRYLRAIPVDPITERRDTWIIVAPDPIEFEGKVADVHSGSPLLSSQGIPYENW